METLGKQDSEEERKEQEVHANAEINVQRINTPVKIMCWLKKETTYKRCSRIEKTRLQDWL